MTTTIFNIIQSNAIGGGMENIFLEYSQILKNYSEQNNIKLICITSKKFCHLDALKKQNIKVEIMNIRGHFDILSSIKLYFLIKKYSPKLIISHNGRAFATVNLYKKIFSRQHTDKKYQTLAVSHGGNIKRILNFDYAISVAKHIERKITNSNFKGLATTIYNGYKTSPFVKNNQQKNNFIFGTLSRLSKEKNLSEAIKAFKKFNDLVEKKSLLIIAGEGEEKHNLEKMVKEYDLENNVKFIGWIKDKEGFFNQIDIFLQPALSEPFGMTILEAFNYKTPVIACDSFGPKEIIKDEYNGYLFNPDDKESLFIVMKKSYLQKKQSSVIIQNANLDLREKFSYETMKNNLIEFIKKIINKPCH